jgi:hypothetical protein
LMAEPAVALEGCDRKASLAGGPTTVKTMTKEPEAPVSPDLPPAPLTGPSVVLLLSAHWVVRAPQLVPVALTFV